MGISIQLNYNSQVCKLEAKISDSLNRGEDGIVSIHISGNTSNLTSTFTNLTSTPQTISFNVPKNGNIFRFDGTVDIDIDFAHHTIFAQTCSS